MSAITFDDFLKVDIRVGRVVRGDVCAGVVVVVVGRRERPRHRVGA